MGIGWRPVYYVHRVFKLKCGGSGCSNYRLIRSRCGKRTCPTCRRRDYHRLWREYGPALKSFQHAMLLTLTLINVPELNKAIVKQLRTFMKQLFRCFESQIRGGLYAIELVNNGRGWHVHVHILLDGLYIPQRQLSDAWRKITGGSFVVDIRWARSPQGALKYILKYLTKEPDIPDHLKGVYDHVLKGVRLIHPFGTLYNWVAQKYRATCRLCSSAVWRLVSLWGEWPPESNPCVEGLSPPPFG